MSTEDIQVINLSRCFALTTLAYIDLLRKWIWDSHASIILAKSNAGFFRRFF